MKRLILIIILASVTIMFAMSEIPPKNDYNFSQNVSLSDTQKGDSFKIQIDNGDIFLSGNNEGRIELKISYAERYENDVQIVIEKDELKVMSKSDNYPEINKITGTLPNNILLNLATVGTVDLQYFHHNNMNIATVSGDQKISDCTDIKEANLATVSGEIYLNNIADCLSIEANSVSGDINLSNCSTIVSLVTNSISGDLIINSTSAESSENNTVSGDILIKNSSMGNINCASMSGDIVFRESDYHSGKFESISGDIIKGTEQEVY